MSTNKICLMLAMVGLLTILTACQRQAPNEQENNDQSRSVKIPVYQFNGVSASARLQGTLQLKGECLYVDDTLIIFPEQSAHWDAQHQTLTYNDKKIALGEEIVIGGGSGRFALDSQRIKNLSPLCKQQSLWLAG